MPDFKVVLVEPEHPHNVGFVARAMRANALTELRIVYSGRTEVMKESYRTAHNASEILGGAQVFHALGEALADCQFSVAFSRRVFNCLLSHVMLPDLVPHLPAAGNVALVFGRESRGLFVTEVNLCSLVCEIPVPGLMSLNLAQAASVAFYELCRTLGNGSAFHAKAAPGELPANSAQIETFIEFLRARLGERYKNRSYTDAFVRKVMQRMQPSKDELDAMFGLARSLSGSFARNERKRLPNQK